MQYNAGRDRTEELGNVFHYFVGAREAALAAATQANKARDEYQQGLTKLMTELGISLDMMPHVNVQWHTGIVTVRDPFTPAAVPTPAPSDGVGIPA